jgi:hypothetical protein
MIFVGCSDENRVASPDPDSGAQVVEMPSAPLGPSHLAVSTGDLLRWNPPANADDAAVTGYNLYILDPQVGSYSRWNTSPIANPRVVVATFTPASSYWFLVTALNSEGDEGALSEPTRFVAVGPDNRGEIVQQEIEQPENQDPYQP